MTHVVDGVFQLRRRERPLPPVRSRLPLVGRQIEEPAHDRSVAGGVVVIDQARGHLHVEQERWTGLNRMQDEAHLLATGVHDGRAAGLGHQSPEGLKLAHRQRIDHRQRVWGRHLDQAELAAVGVLRHEFRVEGEVGVVGEPGDERCQL